MLRPLRQLHQCRQRLGEVDSAWAKWIAAQPKRTGCAMTIQVTYFQPGMKPRRVDVPSLRRLKQAVAVVSQTYLDQSTYDKRRVERRFHPRPDPAPACCWYWCRRCDRPSDRTGPASGKGCRAIDSDHRANSPGPCCPSRWLVVKGRPVGRARPARLSGAAIGRRDCQHVPARSVAQPAGPPYVESTCRIDMYLRNKGGLFTPERSRRIRHAALGVGWPSEVHGAHREHAK